MTEGHDHVVETAEKAHERAVEVLEELVSVASADRVFSEPVVAGDSTVIAAAEIRTGMGFGYGLDAGSRGWGWRRGGNESPSGGGGGGGGAAGRPVAIVRIDPDGVHVLPVWDRTKIVLTTLTALGAVSLTLIRLRRTGRR